MDFRRTILKQDLAVKLFPDSISVFSAMQLLRKEIRQHPQLEAKLYSDNINRRVHYFTHKQLAILLEHFCVSDEEFRKL